MSFLSFDSSDSYSSDTDKTTQIKVISNGNIQQTETNFTSIVQIANYKSSFFEFSSCHILNLTEQQFNARPLAANNLLSLAIGPQKLVTIINISNAALAP